MTDQSPAPTTPSLSQALLFWLKLGFISFGGPAGQIALMHQELVERRRWLSEGRFLHALNYCMMLPGPEAQQLATYLGWLLHRTVGGVLAGLLFILPSLLLMILLGWLYMEHADLAWVQGIFYGIKPVVTVIVLHSAWRIGTRVMVRPLAWLIAAAAFLALFIWNVPFPWVVAGAALAGYFGGRWLPEVVGNQAKPVSRPALIDDHSVPEPHMHFLWWRLLLVIAIALLLWCLPMWLLLLHDGWDGTLTQMAWFFTKAALLTFGGGYAVLPYLSQGAIEDFAWVTAGQMIDALALGETTPGPLIMIVALIAFVGAYPQEVPGLAPGLVTAIWAALVVTWFTFLPSFVFILAGAPLIETTQGKLPLRTALAGITAAVVGVILNLAFYFAYHVFWPEGLAQGVDWLALAIAGLAALALWGWKRSTLSVIIGCALLGVCGKGLGLV